jgi:hypothetical protein
MLAHSRSIAINLWITSPPSSCLSVHLRLNNGAMVHESRNALFGKKFGDQAGTRKPLAVFCFEELFLNNAVSINEKIAWTREALLHTGGFLI